MTFLFQRLIERQTLHATERGWMTYAQKVGSTICPMAKKFGEGGRREREREREVLNETLGKVSGGREMDERKKVSAVQRCCERCGGAREIAP